MNMLDKLDKIKELVNNANLTKLSREVDISESYLRKLKSGLSKYENLTVAKYLSLYNYITNKENGE